MIDKKKNICHMLFYFIICIFGNWGHLNWMLLPRPLYPSLKSCCISQTAWGWREVFQRTDLVNSNWQAHEVSPGAKHPILVEPI